MIYPVDNFIHPLNKLRYRCVVHVHVHVHVPHRDQKYECYMNFIVTIYQTSKSLHKPLTNLSSSKYVRTGCCIPFCFVTRRPKFSSCFIASVGSYFRVTWNLVFIQSSTRCFSSLTVIPSLLCNAVLWMPSYRSNKISSDQDVT